MFKTGAAQQGLPFPGTHKVFVFSGMEDERYECC